MGQLFFAVFRVQSTFVLYAISSLAGTPDGLVAVESGAWRGRIGRIGQELEDVRRQHDLFSFMYFWNVSYQLCEDIGGCAVD